MGASSSTQQNHISPEQRELESEAASIGALSMLHKAFSKLSSNPQTNAIPLVALQEIFSFTYNNPTPETNSIPECFPRLLVHLGQAIVDLFFRTEKGGVTWIEFLRGYISCCGRNTASTSLNNLYRLYAVASAKAGNPTNLEFESDEVDSKISGFLMPNDVLVLLWVCWVMSQSSTILRSSEGENKLDIPDIEHLVLSAVVSCAEVGNDLKWDSSISSLEHRLPAGKLHMWALTTVLGLVHCLTQYLHDRLQKCAAVEDELGSSNLSIGEISLTEANDSYLLTSGRAWAISLTLRNKSREEILNAPFLRDGNEVFENLLYRSAIHGKGLNRFWSNIEGYNGPLLILVSASSGDAYGGDGNVLRWVIGILTEQGFENKEVFYGNPGCLYAISPFFHVFSSSGKEKNFVYSHLHPAGRVYEPHPKPVGIAFGGTIGNERIFVDEDFARLTIRHHAVDKSYQHGPLAPNQGFLPLEASIIEVEVWGLAGGKAKQEQSAYKKREQLFTEQRRKVDLKTFGSWEDSPEKMMMDMVTDPNQVRREDR